MLSQNREEGQQEKALLWLFLILHCFIFQARRVGCPDWLRTGLTHFSYKWFCDFRPLMLTCSYSRVCHTRPTSRREHLPCMQSPSVQFLDCSTSPSQSFPPFLGAGAVHSLRRQWVHSVPQVDHLLQDVHLPSTETRKGHNLLGVHKSETKTERCTCWHKPAVNSQPFLARQKDHQPTLL